MRKAGLILGIVGGLAAGFLGIKWLSDANADKAALDLMRSVGMAAEIDKIITAGYVLLVSAVLGFVGGFMALKGKGKIAAVLMIVGAIAPVIFEPRALVFTFILLVGGLVSFFAKPDAEARASSAGV